MAQVGIKTGMARDGAHVRQCNMKLQVIISAVDLTVVTLEVDLFRSAAVASSVIQRIQQY